MATERMAIPELARLFESGTVSGLSEWQLLVPGAPGCRVVGASARMAAGHSVAQAASHSISSLVEGALSSMFYRKMATVVLIACGSGIAVTTTAVMARQEKKAGPASGGGPFEYSKASMKNAGAPPESKQKTKVIFHLPTHPQAVQDPKTRQVLEKLEEPIAMSFANETPLEHILKYIKQATTTPTFNGIPIYVDPIGLQEAERSLNSTVQIDLEGVPLRRTLQLVLAQIGLMYFETISKAILNAPGSLVSHGETKEARRWDG